MGEVRRSMVLVTESLSLADELLRQRLNQRPLCRNDTPILLLFTSRHKPV